MTKMQKRKIKKAAFYIRRSLIRWAVMFAVGLGALCLAVFLLEETNSRWIIEAALAFFAVLYVGDKFYSKKEDSE
jgi:cation transport ATPase